MNYPKVVENLIQQLILLPGVGRRSAERMVFWFLNQTLDENEAFARCIQRLKNELTLCRSCHNLSEQELCRVCLDTARDHSTICVVEDHKHLLAIERTGSYKGIYYVLLGAISPADGRGPEDLNLQPLKDRIQEGKVREIVIATDPDTEGEMTALHITEQIRRSGVKISRIGLGIPVGSSVEYADTSTLTVSLTSRREL
jgi:recombination protein RecR